MYIIARYIPSRCVEPWVPTVAHLYKWVIWGWIWRVLQLFSSWAFLIKLCLLSIVVVNVVVVVIVNFHIIIFFSWTRGPISTKHPWGRGIQICSNEGPRPFPRRNYYEIAKIHWLNLKILFSRTTGQISTKFGIMHLLIGWAVFFSSLNQRYDIIICVLFCQVSDVAHGLLVFNVLNICRKCMDNWFIVRPLQLNGPLHGTQS